MIEYQTDPVVVRKLLAHNTQVAKDRGGRLALVMLKDGEKDFMVSVCMVVPFDAEEALRMLK